ncbi:MAG: ribose-phosphate pyrophosphokinase [Nanoarchaeota archaeon]|nr:ribose-phosphate pyrophosphokinase [Nanoarchaeota archaeon]MBU1004520.1 ribose-phosphate pyrophosphokinase [Nanoarchaeota archaeon]MBU1945943.1 ribose-phosphate pyrophosphokinase [Nanoarchaeota archaeon]
MSNEISLIAGTANIELAKEIASHLNIPLTPIEIKHFNDGEIYLHIEKSVRGSSVFIIQPTSTPVNENLMQLLLITDACKRASAKEITAVIPYYGYSRQDRKALPREPISAKLVANLIESAGADRVVTFDLHVDQIQGFFNIPVDNLEAISLIADNILSKNIKDIVVVAPDVGGARRARRLAKILDTNIAIIDKRRPEHGVAEIMNIIGEVKGKNAILIDDMIDSAGTITGAAKALKEKGANDIYIVATHAILSGNAIEKLKDSSIKEVIVTNTIDIPKEKRFNSLKIISLAHLLADSITKIYEGTPMGVLFDKLYHNIEEKRKKA